MQSSVSSFIKRAQAKKAQAAQSGESMLIQFLADRGIRVEISPSDSKFDIYNKVYGVNDYWNQEIFREPRENTIEYLMNITRKIDISEEAEKIELELE